MRFFRPCLYDAPHEPVGRHFRGRTKETTKKGWEPDCFGFPPPVNINVSAVDFHFHKPFHSGFALELLHLLGILAAQFLDLLIIRLDAVKDGFGTQVVPAQRADACAHRSRRSIFSLEPHCSQVTYLLFCGQSKHANLR